MRWTASSASILAAVLSGLSGCPEGHGGSVPYFALQLDVHGASNSQCTLAVANGDQHVEFAISAPDSPVADTSLAVPAAPSACGVILPDASNSVQVTMSGPIMLSATRTSTSLCAFSRDSALMTQLGYTPHNTLDCPVVVTLTCGGVALYNRVPWRACIFEG